ncbi:uncharacterized protein EI90DRAFT_3293931 [Cantharellus anzutake]|uniref:uncharacterized protein n=1 Tax=Cantharellus anzutake TaxID=1750568 RepID=UPI0019074DDB|nr:uncharacterized protein EI90DRAFT_3162986 [Cantharellus anzutake]XP_038908892.1 uncharacterized protein EI90DRAFT_3293931 [Cantharellus anzutake]KAF8307647.1 hypothetical protein EI90DRAFT_3162986 [Cantharellus anzutake]KAF8315520.1 hypothetical protein EI90DRAFT_3293931 [Cantharellus anzutake]
MKAPKIRSRAKRDQYRQAGIGPKQFRAMPREEAVEAHRQRMEGIDDPQVRREVEAAEELVDSTIFKALKNTVQLDIDYATVAMHNDEATPPSKSQARPIELALPTMTPEQMAVLRHPDGAAIEDRSGVLLAIRLPNVLMGIHENMVNAGHKLSHTYKFTRDQYRATFNTASSDLFKNGQIQYGYRYQIGRTDIPPGITKDARQCVEQSHAFHKQSEAFHHILNQYLERLAPNLSRQSRRMWDSIRRDRDPEGYLAHIKCHFFSQFVRFNAGTKFHADKRSCWSGFDAIAVFGEYDGGELQFEDLKCGFPSRPSDLFFIRGAGLRHDAASWSGSGRMVIALFSDRRVFFHESVERPRDLYPVYGKTHKAFRRQHPCTMAT